MITHIPNSTSRMAAAKSARMNCGMLATLPFPLPWPTWAILAAWALAAGPGSPFAASEEVTADLNRVIRTVPRMAKPRLAP
jgi:hypothetical protein